jgi:hypothetical protein
MDLIPHALRRTILIYGVIYALTSLVGCVPAEPPESSEPRDRLDESVISHGGLDRWSSYGTLEYDFQKGDSHEHHLIDLQSRKLLLTGDQYTIGFDGQEVWVMPDMEAFSGRPRFYSSLNFYFFAIPFVLADPGTVRESLGRRMFNDKPYDVMKVSYEPGVGDSPDDYYLTYLDTTSHRVELLLYTVTFRSQKPNENYGARTFEWHEVDGLVVPSKISSHRWNKEDEALGEHRSDAYFSNVKFSPDRPDDALFAMPVGAAIDPMPEAATNAP